MAGSRTALQAADSRESRRHRPLAPAPIIPVAHRDNDAVAMAYEQITKARAKARVSRELLRRGFEGLPEHVYKALDIVEEALEQIELVHLTNARVFLDDLPHS